MTECLALFSSTLWVHLSQLGSPLRWDSHIFVIAGQQVGLGLLPYRDLWELKPPGVFYYIAAVLSVLPHALWSIRLADFVLYLLAGVAFYRLCRREAGVLVALAGTTVWLYFSHHEQFNLGGVYTEEYAAIAAVIAVALAAAYSAGGRWPLAFLSGVAVAAAGLCKHPGFAALVPAAILVFRRLSIGGLFVFFLGVTLTLGSVVGYFWLHGALDDFLAANIWELQRHGALTRVGGDLVERRLQELSERAWEKVSPHPVLIAALAVGLPVSVLRPTWLRFATLGWLATDLLGVAAQRYYYEHHFILVFPSTCLLGTLGLAWLLEPRRGESWFRIVPRALAAATVLWLAAPQVVAVWTQRQPEVRRQWRVLLSGPSAWRRNPAGDFEEKVGRYVRERSDANDRVHVQGWGGSVVGVYWWAQRRVATRYFYEIPFPIDQNRAIGELRQNRPLYVVMASHPPFQFLTPWLEADYSIETTKWHDYRSDIWVRNQDEDLNSGTLEGLSVSPDLGALVLKPQAETGRAARARLSSPRRGTWTSPVLPVRSDDGKVFVDWNPRADLAWNRADRGFAGVEATFTNPGNDARAVLGVATRRGFWTAWPRGDPQAVTIRLGFQTMIDQVELVPNDPSAGGPACETPVVESSAEAEGKGAAEFTAVQGTWERTADGVQAIRFAPRAASAVRVSVTPASCGTEGGLRRVRVRQSGRGIIARYRTGADPNLEGQAWQSIEDGNELAPVRADRYVQLQLELWSDAADYSPVLRVAQLGRARYELRTAR